jgi:hypothetical protein
MIVNIRSPYVVIINEANQVSTRLELFIWKHNQTEPIVPTYNLSMNIASVSIKQNKYNISNYIAEYIENTNPIYSVGNNDSDGMYAHFKYKTYKVDSAGDETLLATVSGVGIEGYTDYLDGLNKISTDNVLLLADNDKTIVYDRNKQYPYINYIAKTNSVSVSYADVSGGNINTLSIPSTSNYRVYRVPITTNISAYDKGNSVTINGVKFNVEPECGYRHKSVLCSFINRYGGWSFITFLGNSLNTIDTSNSQYNLMPDSLPYNVNLGQVRNYNTNGTQSVKLNTGWVDENYSELITELMLSETVLLDSKPAYVKSRGSELKSYTNAKLINYEVEFTYAYNLINNII